MKADDPIHQIILNESEGAQGWKSAIKIRDFGKGQGLGTTIRDLY